MHKQPKKDYIFESEDIQTVLYFKGRLEFCFAETIGVSFLKIFLIAQHGSGPDGKGLWRCLRQVPPRSQCCLRCHFLGEKSTNIEDNWEILRTNREILTNNLMMPVIHRLETRASQRRSCSECEPFWEFAAASFKRCSMASPLSLVRHRWYYH